MTQDEEIQRAEAAKRIYNDPLFKEAMTLVREEILRKWEATPARDTDGREWLWLFHQASNKFENTFKEWLETGKMAEIQKEQPSVFKRMRAAL